MAQVKITERGAKGVTLDRKPRYQAGDVVEVSENMAKVLLSFTYAELVSEPDAEPEVSTGPTEHDLEVAYRYNSLRDQAATEEAPKGKPRRSPKDS